MTFLVKRSIGNDYASREFCLKQPKRARKHLNCQEPSTVGALEQGFDTCLKNIVNWLDESPTEHVSEDSFDQDSPPAA